jgi:hypothetical protein
MVTPEPPPIVESLAPPICRASGDDVAVTQIPDRDRSEHSPSRIHRRADSNFAVHRTYPARIRPLGGGAAVAISLGMKLVLLLVIVGCGPALTGDGLKDLGSFSDAVDVDCSSEPMCVTQPHCMTDALRDGQVGVYTVSLVMPPVDPVYDTEHLFTYGDGVALMYESHENLTTGSVKETHCTSIEAKPVAGGCWTWQATGCTL